MLQRASELISRFLRARSRSTASASAASLGLRILVAVDRGPRRTRTIVEAALAAERRYDYREALRLWRTLIERRNVRPGWSERYAANLITIGHYEEADAILAAARHRHPRHVGLEVCSGLLAAAREDWRTAVDVLIRFQGKDPENPVAQELLGRILQLREHASIAGVTVLVPVPLDQARVENEAVRKLVLGFESLGDDCEFGLVQRRYGAEPLGLFRWNMTTPPSLLLGFASRFEGLGEREHLRLTVDPSTRSYLVQDKRFDFEMHTFMFEGQIDERQLFEKMGKVLRFQRDKFLRDLETSQKILVYKDKDVDQDFILSLCAVLRRYGPVRLLWVLPLNSPAAGRFPRRRAGEVVAIDDMLSVGFLSRFGSAGGTWDIQFDEWVSLCARMAQVAETVDAEPQPA